MNASKSALFSIVLLSVPVPAVAEGAGATDTKLDTVVVQGSRLNQTEAEVGTSVSIITAQEIDKLGFDFSIDAVAAAPGVTVNQNGPFGGAASVRIRGASTGQTLVLIDGVPVGDPSATDGSFNFAYLDTENIARIEVLKGPQSTLWGTDAIGGVISIVTKQPDKGLGGSAFGEIGSYNTLRGGASIATANHAGEFRLAASSIKSDGISKADEGNGNRERDGYDSSTLSARAGLNFPNQIRFDTALLWNDAEADFDSYAFGAQGSVADGDENARTKSLSGHASLKIPLFGERFENLLMVGYSDISRKNFTNGAPVYSAEGNRTLYRYQGTFKLDDRNKFAFGAEREETTANNLNATLDGLFALYEYKPIQKLTLTGGLRIDDHEKFGSETTGRLAAAYRADDRLILRASWGQGFKGPSIFQSTYICTFCGLTESNNNLKPETSEAFDIGLDWSSQDDRTQASLTYFDQDTENMIDFSYTVGYDNIALVKSKGIELSASHRFTDWLSVLASCTYIDAKNGSGNDLVQMPQLTGDLTVLLDPDGPFSGAILVRYNGEEPSFDGTKLDGWTRVDLAGSYGLTRNIEVFGRVENLFDEHYQQILGYGTPGVSGSFGLRLRY